MKTVIEAGIARVSRVSISTFSARKIIRVVTSPVIRETPPELTAKTTSVTNWMRFFSSRSSDRIREHETKVAVILSAKEEKMKQKRPVRKSSRLSLTCFGMIR